MLDVAMITDLVRDHGLVIMMGVSSTTLLETGVAQWIYLLQGAGGEVAEKLAELEQDGLGCLI